MRLANDVRRLAQLQHRLGEMWQEHDWAGIVELDGVIRQQLQRLHDIGPLTEEAVARLAPLKQLHAQVLEAGYTEYQRLRVILSQHVEHSEGRNAYSLADSVQGVE